MEEAQASQLIPVNRSISLTLLLHQTLFPPSHHSPDQTSMIKFLPRVAQEGAGVAIAIANHPWFGRQGKPGRSSQVKAGGRRAFEAVCTQAHPGSQIALPALSPGWTHPSAKSVCKRRILQWCSPAYSNRNDPFFLQTERLLQTECFKRPISGSLKKRLMWKSCSDWVKAGFFLVVKTRRTRPAK